jgi:N-formylglutamate amidohydrolase
VIIINFQNYIEFRKGTIPLVFSVPHGGTTNFDDIPDRVYGIHGVDKETIKLTFDLIEKFREFAKMKFKNNWTPSYIISKIKRIKIDFNRKETDAFHSKSNLAREIYYNYHNKILELINSNLNKYNRSILIDIHGFEKVKRPKGFRDVELVLGTNNLESMFPEKLPKKVWGRNFRGKIIKKFNELNIPIAPGIHTRKEYVLTGGYIIQKYGASRIKNSQAIQIEFSDAIRLCDNQLRKNTLESLAQLFFEEFSSFNDEL